MYLQHIQLLDIKCFENLFLDLTHNGKPRLMTVILGDNGVGKSTLLQSMAVVLGGADVSRLSGSWTRIGQRFEGNIKATVVPGEGDEKSGQRKPLQINYLATWPEMSPDAGNDALLLQETLYQESVKGWFAAGYGPFRRLLRANLTSFAHLQSERKSDRFASLFGNDGSLIDLEDWLIELDRRALKDEIEGLVSPERRLLDRLIRILPQLLPKYEGASANRTPDQVHITKDRGVLWRDGFGQWVPLLALSDGYLSTLAWTGDLATRLSRAFPEAENPFEQEGVVLIDEIDIHLHPAWQRTILAQLRHAFPKIQFIVTTHSPLVTGGAKEGELVVLRREGEQVIADPEPSVQGWRADQILTSDLFGLESTRDHETEQELREYDALLGKQAMKTLSTKEKARLNKLETKLQQRLPPPGESVSQRDFQQRIETFIEQVMGAAKKG